MNWKKHLITWLVLLVLAAAVVAATVFFERDSHGTGTRAVVQYLSDGCFTVSVLYIGCAVLMAIQETGNFYGIQYLFYTLVRLFSFGRDRYSEKKDYFTYCTEKKERQAAEGKSPLKPAMFLMGLIWLALSLLFAVLFYRTA